MAEKKEIIVRAAAREGRGRMMRVARVATDKFPSPSTAAKAKAVAALAPLSELAAILRSDTGRNTIFTVDVEGVGASEVMFADRQIDPVRDASGSCGFQATG